MCDLNKPEFQDADKAREYLEAIRWPTGPVCPHCGGIERNSQLQGESHRAGLYFCGDCRSQFTVTVGTVFERSKIPLHKWALATHLMCSSKKGISAHQLHRMLGVTYKTAWFMAHRIREAMKPNGGGLLGSKGGAVEADETYWGKASNQPKRRGSGASKMKILSLVEREGQARSFHISNVTGKTLAPILKANIAKQAHLMTDEAPVYGKPGKTFADHSTVQHRKYEYVRGNVYTNTVEGYFALLKRGLIGTFHHVGEQHLQRYVNEFDFRYNHRTKLGYTDAQRATAALKGISGKRLTYKRPNATA